MATPLPEGSALELRLVYLQCNVVKGCMGKGLHNRHTRWYHIDICTQSQFIMISFSVQVSNDRLSIILSLLVCVRVCVHIRVCVRVCVHVHMCVCMCVHA